MLSNHYYIWLAHQVEINALELIRMIDDISGYIDPPSKEYLKPLIAYIS